MKTPWMEEEKTNKRCAKSKNIWLVEAVSVKRDIPSEI